MPTSLQRGVVTLLSEFTVCKMDQALKPEQARILVRETQQTVLNFTIRDRHSYYISLVRFESIIAVKIQVKVFWVVMVCTDDRIMTFWRTWLPSSSGRRWWQQGPLKSWYPAMSLCSITTQKNLA